MRPPGAKARPALLAAALLAMLLRAAPARAVEGALPPISAPPPSGTPAAPPAVVPWTPPPPEPDPPEVSSGYASRPSSTNLGFDVRGELHSLFKIYSGGGDAGGGGGVAVSVELRQGYNPSVRRPRWGAFVIGLGQAVHYDAYAIGGIGAKVVGGGGIPAGVTSFLELESSFHLGVRAGLGAVVGPTTWRGVVLGAAWAPTYAYFTGTSRFGGGGGFNPAGLRFAADLGSLELARHTPQPIFRTTLTWLPHVDNLPTVLSLGFGAAFY